MIGFIPATVAAACFFGDAEPIRCYDLVFESNTVILCPAQNMPLDFTNGGPGQLLIGWTDDEGKFELLHSEPYAQRGMQFAEHRAIFIVDENQDGDRAIFRDGAEDCDLFVGRYED